MCLLLYTVCFHSQDPNTITSPLHPVNQKTCVTYSTHLFSLVLWFYLLNYSLGLFWAIERSNRFPLPHKWGCLPHGTPKAFAFETFPDKSLRQTRDSDLSLLPLRLQLCSFRVMLHFCTVKRKQRIHSFVCIFAFSFRSVRVRTIQSLQWLTIRATCRMTCQMKWFFSLTPVLDSFSVILLPAIYHTPRS